MVPSSLYLYCFNVYFVYYYYSYQLATMYIYVMDDYVPVPLCLIHVKLRNLYTYVVVMNFKMYVTGKKRFEL